MTAKIPEKRIPHSPVARRAWIRLRLAEANTNLKQLAKDRNYSYACLRQAMIKAKPKAQEMIAAAIGMKPEVIWPERFKGKAKKKADQMERAA